MGLRKTADEKEAARARRAEEQWLATPVGEAWSAHQAGEAFFQLEIDVGMVGDRARWAPFAHQFAQKMRRGIGRPDLLGQIEDVGWHLENVGYVFAKTGEVRKGIVSYAGTVTEGAIIGMYLFRRVD